MAKLELPPLTLYIHIPWCVKKCPYCDFNSHGVTGEIPEAGYVEALIKDLETDAHLAQGRKLLSLFFGGGTPSLFSPAAIEAVIEAAERVIGIAPDAEITLEANPGTFEREKFRAFRETGVNRLSIGIQSFNDQHLQVLGRIHSSTEAIEAVAAAREAGFSNMNLDLMHGLPEQTPGQALADIEQAIRLEPSHLSWYQLTIEPNTRFYSAPPILPVDEQLEAIQSEGLAAIAEAGFARYEVSAFARSGRQSRHNLNYWGFGDYIGIGAGAHGKLTCHEQGRIIRRQKTRLPKDYLNKANLNKDRLNKEKGFLAGQRELTAEELPLEFFMNALRLNQGVPKTWFSQRTGLDFDIVAPTWETLADENLVQADNNRLVATELGQRFLNTVLSRF